MWGQWYTRSEHIVLWYKEFTRFISDETGIGGAEAGAVGLLLQGHFASGISPPVSPEGKPHASAKPPEI